LLKRQEKNLRQHRTWRLLVHPKDVSKMTGHRRNNITYLQEEFDINLKVKIWEGQAQSFVSLCNQDF
jgi:predicted PilT family ATPase